MTRELELIRFVKGLPGTEVIGDDCAVLSGNRLVTTDMLVEGVHFLAKVKAADLGFKAVAVNLSDIAAMGGRPQEMLVSLSLPPELSGGEGEELMAAIYECGTLYKTRLVGGDVCGGDKLVVCITVIGEAGEFGPLMRSCARPGDYVVVTGDFGASAAGLYLLLHGLAGYEHCRGKHLRPIPRLSESWALGLASGGTGALMDASDGLADALLQIACQSGVGMDIHAERIPIHPETVAVARRSNQEPLDLALYGGEDYELVGAVDERGWSNLEAREDNPFQVIGRVTSEMGVRTFCQGRSIEVRRDKVFNHFHSGPAV